MEFCARAAEETESSIVRLCVGVDIFFSVKVATDCHIIYVGLNKKTWIQKISELSSSQLS